ncbi:O-antigen ligase family protein [Vibrio amylolyticus]|uniref:O-antigen ligase family protein n=1 Tax=Vibrio amylolyticus TaxID=2847292 RepID=UPI00354EB461
MSKDLLSHVIRFLNQYGFYFVILYCIGAFSPALYSKSALLSKDLDTIISSKSGSAIFKQIFWLGLFFFYTVSVFSSREVSRFTSSTISTLLILITICFTIGVTALWSAYPSLTIKRSIFQLAFCGTVYFSIYNAYNQKTIGRCITLSLYTIYGLTFLSIIMGYGFSASGALTSFAKNKNLFAASLVIIIVVMITLKDCKIAKVVNYKYNLAILLTLLVLTQSKTNIAILMFFYLLTRLPLQLNRLILSLIYIFCIFVFVLLYTVNDTLGFSHTILDYIDEGFLTGRGFIWDLLYYDLHFFDKWATGYGYGAYFGTPEIPYFFDDSYSFTRFITSAHNGYIEHVMQLGVFMSMLLGGIYFVAASLVNNRHLLSLMCIPILHNITESSMIKDSSIIWFSFIFCLSISSLLKTKTLDEK